MDFLPINIRISDGKVLIVGGGKVATHKAKILARFTKHAVVIAENFSEEIKELSFKLIEKKYDPEDLKGYRLVFICTDDHELNHEIKRQATEQGILASVCDDTSYCDFVSPAIYKKDNLTIAVGTDGKQVKRAIAVRNQIKEKIEDGRIQID